MEYSYKFRIYPSETQVNLIQRTFGCVRFVYNHYLAQRIERYKATGKMPRQQGSKGAHPLRYDIADPQR